MLKLDSEDKKTKNEWGERIVEKILMRICSKHKLTLMAQYKFHPTRKWRFDFAVMEKKVAIEVEGATWANGRHNRGSGFLGDCIKYNEASFFGWRLIRIPTAWIECRVSGLEYEGNLNIVEMLERGLGVRV